MTKFAIFLLMFIVSSPVFSQTYFDHIGQMFSSGQQPVVSEMTGVVWTGRCFKRQTPNSPTNIGLYVREKEMSDDAGPISLPLLEIANYTFHQRPANFLDDKDHDFLAPYIEPLYESLLIKHYHFRFYNRRTGSGMWSYLRKNGDYLFHVFYDDFGREGHSRCYYWIP